MNCEEISELLPAYVLGALEPDEVEAVEAHLREGREHDQELVELRATVFALDRYREELIPTPAPAPDMRRSTPAVLDRPRRAESRPAAPRVTAMPWWRAAVAAAVLVLAFAGGWVASSVLGGDGTAYAVAVRDGDSFMEVRGNTSGDTVVVTMSGLERAPEGRSYQVWAVRDGEWVSIGTCNTNAEGWWRGDFAFSIRDGEVVALTMEPRGGSESPTGEVILASLP